MDQRILRGRRIADGLMRKEGRGIADYLEFNNGRIVFRNGLATPAQYNFQHDVVEIDEGRMEVLAHSRNRTFDEMLAYTLCHEGTHRKHYSHIKTTHQDGEVAIPQYAAISEALARARVLRLSGRFKPRVYREGWKPRFGREIDDAVLNQVATDPEGCGQAFAPAGVEEAVRKVVKGVTEDWSTYARYVDNPITTEAWLTTITI